jgi:type IV pilus assembly protein PilY1
MPIHLPLLARASRKKLYGIAALAFCGLAATMAFVARSAIAPPAIPLINLSSEPLYARGSQQKPTLTLALSVEYPTVGAQYTPGGNSDNTYNPVTEYLGYFDADSCYTYNNNSDESLRRFDRSGAASGHGCGGTGFSGNFMNWATSSAIDVLRLGLTGGDRIVDTSSLTVLQRAVLRRNAFWNDSNFPAKQLLAAYVANAVPTALRGTYTGDIWIANCLNRTHFGTARDGNCDSPGRNSNLGVPGAATRDSVRNDTLLNQIGSIPCAAENGQCAFTGVKRVFYGAGASWRSVAASGGIACTNDVFGDPIPGVVKACYVKDDTSGWTPTGNFGSASLSSNNFFYTRVQVCDNASTSAATPRQVNGKDFCLRYPNGNYKPVGNLQRYSDRVRVAAFGYLMDDDRNRYGGVLRAAMKYVGPKSFDGDGILSTGTNPLIEWDENSGVFRPNPDNATVGNSGVINYLNQFGRTGAVTGTYKTNDPVSELYYESLRYLQGLGPTPQAISNINDTMRDGFNLYDTWTDPHASGSRSRDYSCVRNNILLIGDVNTHVDKSIPGYTGNSGDFARAANLANNEPDFVRWTQVVGEFEAGRGLTYTDGSGATRTTSNPNASTGDYMRRDLGNLANRRVSDDASYFIAGMAYWANTHDIRGTDWTASPDKQRPGMRARTYILDVNEYGSQNDLDTRRSNQFFLASKYGGFTDGSGVGNPYLNDRGALDNTIWSKSGDPAGEAKSYFLSSSAQSVLQAIDDIFASIAKTGNTIAGGSAASSQITSAGNSVYVGSFDAENWSGDVRKYDLALNVNGTGATLNLASNNYSAAQKLDARTTDRNIVIGRSSGVVSATYATPFLWDSIDSSAQAALNRSTPTATSDNQGQARLNFLRGDRSNETSLFRTRTSRMGDIINSAVVYSGAPAVRYSDDAYQTFYTANKDRAPTVFVGANDGMLHAFNASTLDETFAYIPSWMTPSLSRLSSVTYNSGLHTSYVDSTPAVAEAQFTNGDWKTVLVSGTGAGGQGVFALDVTKPAEFSASKVLWEFTDRDDADLGNVIGPPQILKFRTSAPTAAAEYKWFAVVASGVNNYANDGAFSATGSPALFLLDLSKPASSAWQLNANYFKISLPVTADALTGTIALGTGLITFNATAGSNREVSQLYMGDLHGNLWRLDFTLQGTTGWNLNSLSPSKTRGNAVPLYIAKDALGKVQPISMQPLLAYGPAYGAGSTTIVFFGTGKYLESSDNIVNASTQAQSVYALFDNGKSDKDTDDGLAIIAGRNRLIAGSVNAGVVSVPPFAWGRPTKNTAPERSGWYVDFPRGGGSGGERQISGASIFGNTVVFGSILPPSAAVDSCGGGSGYGYMVNLATGAGASRISTVGILGKPLVLQTGPGTDRPTIDNLGAGERTETAQVFQQGSGGLMAEGNPPPNTYPTRRISWRQINNYNKLKSAP